MSRSWSFMIPDWHPPSVNDVMGSSIKKRTKIKSQAKNIVSAYCCLYDVDRIVKPNGELGDNACRRRIKAYVLTKPRTSIRFDLDNIWKYLLDGLVDARVLVDDSNEWLLCDPISIVETDGMTGYPSLIVTVTDI